MSVHGTRAKIPPTLHGVLWDRSRDINPASRRVWNDHELAAWLREAHGIECAHDAVTKVLRPFRQAARAAALDVVRERITLELGAQLEALDDIALKVARDARAAKPSARRELFEAYTKFVTMKLRYALGERVEIEADVGVEAKVTVTDARERVAAQLARVAAGAGRREAG